jgi:hypothetical protein
MKPEEMNEFIMTSDHIQDLKKPFAKFVAKMSKKLDMAPRDVLYVLSKLK